VWWDGGGNDNNWDTNANWNPTGDPGTAEIAGFDGDNADSEYSISLNGANRTVSGLYFADSTSDQAFTFTETANEQLRLGADGITNADQVTQVFDSRVRLQSNQTWHLLEASGGLLLNNILILRRDLELLGNGTMILAGSGTLEITDDFTFDGTLQMSTGTLLLSNTGTVFDLGTLHITGNSIIDFTDADITTLNLGELVIDMGATISVLGWTYDVDFWSADVWGGALRDTQALDPTTRVTFNGYTAAETIWLTEGDEITVPEPSTYGAIFMGAGLAGFLRHRRRQNSRR